MYKDENRNLSGYSMAESEKRVCHRCIGNKALSKYIRTNGEMKRCDYCGGRSRSIPFEEFFDVIMDGVSYAYSRAVDELPVEHGEYVGKTYSSDELIYDELSEEINPQNERILDDIVDLMPDEIWCDADPFDNEVEDLDFYSWEVFCKMVREKMRFVFYRVNTDDDYPNDPIGILDRIAKYTQEAKLTRRIDKHTKLFRCRVFSDDKWPTDPGNYAPPKPEHAVPGRMNASGIEMLYLTLEEETAKQETYDRNREYAVVVQYRVEDPIYVLDLSRLDTMDLPSIFDRERRETAHAIKFLKQFADDISRPKVNVNIDTEYVPTQIMTEFFRYVRPKDRDRYDGILYKSTQNPGGKCLVLFMNREDVLTGKHGIHLNPAETHFYKKQYTEIVNDATSCAKKELLAKVLLHRYGDTCVKDIPASSAVAEKEKLV